MVVGEYCTVGEDRELTTKCRSGHDGQGRRLLRKVPSSPRWTGPLGCEHLYGELGIWTDDRPGWAAVLEQDDSKMLD